MVDRKLLKNPNGLILGTPGSGKSFSAKREIANCFLLTNDDVIICDPEAEYAPLVERLHGQVIKISPTSTNYINPMDLNLDYSDDESPLSLKSDFILSLCELIVGGKDGLQPVQKTIIDRCVRLVYQTYLNDPRPENMPILEDLYNLLRSQGEKEAQYIATALEIYVTGQSSPGRAPTGKGKCKCPVPEILAGKSPVFQQSSFPLAAKAGHKKAYAAPSAPVRLPEIPPRLRPKLEKPQGR